MVKLETVLKLAREHGLEVPEEKKLSFDVNKLCPEARADVYRRCAEAWEEVRQKLEIQLRQMHVIPLYRVERCADGKKRRNRALLRCLKSSYRSRTCDLLLLFKAAYS